MRPLSFRPDALRELLLRNQIATLDELKLALGTSVDVTVPGPSAGSWRQRAVNGTEPGYRARMGTS